MKLAQREHSVRFVISLLACLWLCCVPAAGQGNRPSSATVLGSSSGFLQLQALYRNSRQWNKAYRASPKSACSAASSKSSSNAANLCSGSARSKEALAQYNQLLLATSPRAYSSSDTQQTGGLQLVTPPGSQDPCQTCTAFAVAAAAEAAMATALGVDVSQCSISVQALYFCATPISRSCDSGWTLPAALEELQRRGSSLPTAACQPYAPDFRQTDSLCTGICSMTSPFAQQGSFSFVQISSALAAQNHIRQHGAVLARFDIYPGFEAFFRDPSNVKAVYRPPPGVAPQENHAVLLVGYDNDLQFWLARNSWGVDWGDSGLFRVAFDACAVLTPGSEAYGVIWRPKAVPDAVKLPVTPAALQRPGCYWYKARAGDYLSRVAWLAGVPLEQFMLDNTAVVKDLDAPITGLQLLLCQPQPGKIHAVAAEPAGDQTAAATTKPPPQQSPTIDARKPPASDLSTATTKSPQRGKSVPDVTKPAGDAQLQSLLKIKAAIDTTGVLKEWNEKSGAGGGYCKGWRGVGCTEDGSQNVQKINLFGGMWSDEDVSGLQGVLPPASAFDGLSWLWQFQIGYLPGITGTLPSDWSRLQQLQEIQLGASLTGTLPPSWAELTRLKELSIWGNKLRGTLPAAWSGMAAMEVLVLQRNAFTGTLPPEWSQMRALMKLHLYNNTLRGPLPDSFKALTALEDLQLSFNSLTGSLPASWSQLRALKKLHLDNNMLRGPLPDEWSSMAALEVLDLSSNSLTGTLPPTWGQMRALRDWHVHSNKLRGTLPDSFKALTALEVIDLGANSLSGVVPASWQSISYVYVYGNAKLGGCLPRSWKQEGEKFLQHFGGTGITGVC